MTSVHSSDSQVRLQSSSPVKERQSGGRGGMEHMLEQFGPALSLPWTRLEAPALTDELRKRMIDGTGAQAEGTTVEALEQERDRCLIEILAVLAEHRVRAR